MKIWAISYVIIYLHISLGCCGNTNVLAEIVGWNVVPLASFTWTVPTLRNMPSVSFGPHRQETLVLPDWVTRVPFHYSSGHCIFELDQAE